MTEEQVIAEIGWYAYECRVCHPEDEEHIRDIDVYSEDQKRRAMAEVAYYLDKGRLPRWAMMIERVIDGADGMIFVHADPRATF